MLAGAAAVGSVALAGCVTTDLRASAPGIEDSEVFESVRTVGSWAQKRVTLKLSLTDAATTDLGVRELAVIDAAGSSFWTGTVEPGATSVSHVVAPVGEPVSVTAADYNGKFVEAIEVTVEGRRLF